ncbi:hypothetical protein ACP4OV_023570 [Aristida adscensionis]
MACNILLLLVLVVLGSIASARASAIANHTTGERLKAKEGAAVADLLLTAEAEGSWPPAAHVVVSEQEGAGNVMTIGKALEVAPADGTRFVILIKAGVYQEYLNITRHNVVLLGEGIDKTNTAGLGQKQALALRSDTNESVFYKCSFEAFQDTVYAENNLQLFLYSKIYGTVDFIFGNAKAVFFECDLLVRRPVLGEHNVITAQGRNSPIHESGFVFERCRVQAAPGEDLTGVDTFLGRPWKNFSHVVFMDSFLGDIVNATGWIPWKKDQVVEETTRTVAYLEYKNTGPKADTRQRVNWEGFHVLSSAEQAKNYTVDRFIHGSQWVPRPLQLLYRN